VPQVPEATRQRYGGTQEPELTVLKGVGPFVVALYRGAATLGEIDSSAQPPVGTAARTISREQSQQALERIININVGQGGLPAATISAQSPVVTTSVYKVALERLARVV
jgi:hypothetical protein